MTSRHRRDTKCWAKASRISRDDRGRADSSARCTAINSAVRLDRVGMTHHSSTPRLAARSSAVWTRSPGRSHAANVKDPLSQYGQPRYRRRPFVHAVEERSIGLLGRRGSCPPACPAIQTTIGAARPRQHHHARRRTWPIHPGAEGPDRLPRFGRSLCGKASRLRRPTGAGTRAAPLPSHSNATGGNMAALFLVLAVVAAVLLGNAVLANTSASSVSVFDQSITGFTQGQLLLVAAGLGLLGALLLGLAWRSSGARRAKRRQLRAARRDLESKVAELERDNATLRQERERLGRLAELREASSQAQQARERASQPPVDAHA